MARPHRPPIAPATSAAARLADEIAAGTLASGLTPELAGWLAEPRFRAFVEANRAKVRRKLREAHTDEALGDARTELGFARVLLADRRFELGFETYGRRTAGPDFTIRYRSGRATDVEVTRRRPMTTPGVNPYEAPLLAKLRQLQPGVPSVLVIAAEGDGTGRDALDSAARGVVDRAEAADEAWFARRGIASMRVFWTGFHRLGAVIAWREGAPVGGGDRANTWVNANARIRVSSQLLAAIERCLIDAPP